MSDIFKALKSDNLKFRKEKSRYSGESNFIISKINDANKALTKDGLTPLVTDTLVIQELRSYVKQQKQLFDAIKESNDETSKQITLDNIKFAEGYLPEDVSKDQIESDIISILNTLDDKSMKSMGIVIKNLKQKYGDRFNGGVVSPLVKQLLS